MSSDPTRMATRMAEFTRKGIKKGIKSNKAFGERAKIFALVVYQNPRNGRLNMAWHLPDGHAFPDLTELNELINTRHREADASSSVSFELSRGQTDSSQQKDSVDERMHRSSAPSPDKVSHKIEEDVMTPICSSTSSGITNESTASEGSFSLAVKPTERFSFKKAISSAGEYSINIRETRTPNSEEVLINNDLKDSLQELSLLHTAGDQSGPPAA